MNPPASSPPSSTAAPLRLKQLPENLTAQIVEILENPAHGGMTQTAAAIQALLDEALTPMIQALECYRKKSNWDYGIFLGGPSLQGRDVAVKALGQVKHVQTPLLLPDVYAQFGYQQ